MSSKETKFTSSQQIACLTQVISSGLDQQLVQGLCAYSSRVRAVQRKKAALTETSGGVRSDKRFKSQLKLSTVHMYLVTENWSQFISKYASSLQLVQQFK